LLTQAFAVNKLTPVQQSQLRKDAESAIEQLRELRFRHYASKTSSLTRKPKKLPGVSARFLESLEFLVWKMHV
jgi:hypothetical protein